MEFSHLFSEIIEEASFERYSVSLACPSAPSVKITFFRATDSHNFQGYFSFSPPQSLHTHFTLSSHVLPYFFTPPALGFPPPPRVLPLSIPLQGGCFLTYTVPPSSSICVICQTRFGAHPASYRVRLQCILYSNFS